MSNKKKKISLFIIGLIILLISISAINAYDYTSYPEVMPTNLTLNYEDHTATTYQGDAALRNMTFDDELTGTKYIIYSTDDIRTLAKYTNRTMKFDQTIRVDSHMKSNDGNYNIISHFYKKDGSFIRSIKASHSDLTTEEKSYFDNYEEERQDHLAQQIGEDAHSDYIPQKQKQRGVIVGSRGIGYYHSI